MAVENNWGGYRQPSNPAPVSLPGALSRRTDGGPVDGMQPPMNTQAPRYMPGLGYGKGGENMANQQAAPLAGNPTPEIPAPIPLNAPDRYPGIPSTDGMAFDNTTRGPEAVQIPNIAVSPSHTMRTIAQYDPTGEAELIFRALTDRGL